MVVNALKGDIGERTGPFREMDIVEDTDEIDIVEVVVPFPVGLVEDGKGGVRKGPVHELAVRAFLHLDDEALAVGALAIDVEDGEGVGVDAVLLVEEGDLGDGLAGDDGVEELDEQGLVAVCGEEFLETEIGSGAEVSPPGVRVVHTHKI